MNRAKNQAHITRLASKVALSLLAAYKRFLSPLLPRACRFYPTCSEYCRNAVKEYGVLRGGWLGLYRLLRCHPLCRGGFDPVKPRKKKLR